MGIDVKKLKEMIAEKNTTLEAVAGILGIDRTTLYRKLRTNANGLTVNEARRISSFLRLSVGESMAIFWGQ